MQKATSRYGAGRLHMATSEKQRTKVSRCSGCDSTSLMISTIAFSDAWASKCASLGDTLSSPSFRRWASSCRVARSHNSQNRDSTSDTAVASHGELLVDGIYSIYPGSFSCESGRDAV